MNNEVELRLAQCFKVLFPELGDKQVPHATKDSVATWDSVATVTLVNLVEEEFGTAIALEDVEHLNSFAQFLDYLQTREGL
jgi:acyl carrier protein